jgi:aconitate hydratase
MGNSGPLAPAIEREILQRDLFVSAVLSGNRNFENRIHPLAKANYLAAPPLVVAYAIVGTVLVDLTRDPIGKGRDGRNVYLRDIWPTDDEIRTTTAQTVSPELYRAHSRNRSAGSGQWERLSAPAGITFDWDPRSTYIRCPPFLDGISREAPVGGDICEARVLLLLGDSVTTDHISPVGAIPVNGPAGRYLSSCGIAAAEFNSFMSRRVNHDVMIRGTFANPLLRNEMTAGETHGGRTRYMPDGTVMPVYDAAMRYAEERVPLIVIAGKEYGGGSSRDWAAKGARLLGIRAVLAESFERIHRTNLVGMGVLPLEFRDGATRKTLALEGSERFDIRGLESGLGPRANITCTITRADGTRQSIQLLARIDTALEAAWYRNGGVLPFALRTLLSPTLR